MPRVIVEPAHECQNTLDAEIARLRGLGTQELQAFWQTTCRRKAPSHLARHLLFRVLAYRLQANALGDLDEGSQRLLERTMQMSTDQKATTEPRPIISAVRAGTILAREWNGQMHRVTVLPEGFAWNGGTYRSLTKVALAITGTHWNGPRFFGLRNKNSASPKR
jgi:hypothetical protein